METRPQCVSGGVVGTDRWGHDPELAAPPLDRRTPEPIDGSTNHAPTSTSHHPDPFPAELSPVDLPRTLAMETLQSNLPSTGKNDDRNLDVIVHRTAGQPQILNCRAATSAQTISDNLQR